MVPALAMAQGGSTGQFKATGYGSVGSSTTVATNTFFVYKPVAVTETVTTTTTEVAYCPSAVVVRRAPRLKRERVAWIAFPRWQRRVAARTAALNRATATTVAVSAGY